MNVDSVGVLLEGDNTSMVDSVKQVTNLFQKFQQIVTEVGKKTSEVFGGKGNKETGAGAMMEKIGGLLSKTGAGAMMEKIGGLLSKTGGGGGLGGLLSEAGAGFSALGDGALAAAGPIGMVIAVIGALAFAIKELVQFMVECVHAFADMEYALVGLRSIMKDQGIASGLEDSITSIGRTFRKTDDEVIGLMTRLRQYGVEEKKLSDTTKIVMAVAKGTGLSEFQAFRAIEQFQATGHSMLLNRIPAFKQARTEMERIVAIQTLVNQGYSAFAAQGDTLKGISEATSTTWSRTRESIGEILTDEFDIKGLMQVWLDAAQLLESYFAGIRDIVREIKSLLPKNGVSFWNNVSPTGATVHMLAELQRLQRDKNGVPNVADILSTGSNGNGKQFAGAFEMGSKEAYSAEKGNQSILQDIADNTKKMASADERGSRHSADAGHVGVM